MPVILPVCSAVPEVRSEIVQEAIDSYERKLCLNHEADTGSRGLSGGEAASSFCNTRGLA